MKTRATANDAAVPGKASVKPTSALRKGLSLLPRTLRVFPSRSWMPVMARAAATTNFKMPHVKNSHTTTPSAKPRKTPQRLKVDDRAA